MYFKCAYINYQIECSYIYVNPNLCVCESAVHVYLGVAISYMSFKFDGALRGDAWWYGISVL